MSTTAPLEITSLPPRGHIIAQHDSYCARASLLQLAKANPPQISTKNDQKTTQDVLLLKAVKEKYTLVKGHAIPDILHGGEILVKVIAIGLNPIDWKAPAFGFGIPSLPWINGRDLVGQVVRVSSGCSRVKVGDLVLVPSTDYRDIRKAAFQEYAISTYFNAARIPSTFSSPSVGAGLGVAFVTAALSLGLSFGLDFSMTQFPMPKVAGPNLPKIIGRLNIADVPDDVRDECFSSASETQRIKGGDWLAIWGASTTTGYVALQLAKLCGVRVICIADVAKHGENLLDAGADLLVDRLDTKRARDIIRGVTGGRLRFGLDTTGKETASLLQSTLDTSSSNGKESHLLGLTGLPKERSPQIRYHTLPIKIFHSCPTVGGSLMNWLEALLQSSALELPEVEHAHGGLEGINDALDRLRDGSFVGKRIVVNFGDTKRPSK